ncbi:LURP-one-related [Dillenia turbinata]|uniref:LURP-one-related n=1 Tax=Dillenia turbinata TaxID=194707 RepID=A0AAN8W4X0_9MAGN
MGMRKVHPNAIDVRNLEKQSVSFSPSSSLDLEGNDAVPVLLTVWKRSLLFNGNGFTVFDANGNLVFRVDNYVARNKAHILLLDAQGRPLLNLRRKRLGLRLGDYWLVFEGESQAIPRFAVKKNVSLLSYYYFKSLAHVILSKNNNDKNKVVYEIQGSYTQRNCCVYDDKRRCLAEMKRKEAAFGTDVFRLIVHPPHLEPMDAMAVVILVDQMFGS